MSRRWQRTGITGELGICRCEQSPIGHEPTTVVRGGRQPTLKWGVIEHICPTAELAARPPGRKAASASAAGELVRLVLVMPAELKERITSAAGGGGKVNAWGIRALEAAAGATPAKRRRKP